MQRHPVIFPFGVLHVAIIAANAIFFRLNLKSDDNWMVILIAAILKFYKSDASIFIGLQHHTVSSNQMFF